DPHTLRVDAADTVVVVGSQASTLVAPLTAGVGDTEPLVQGALLEDALRTWASPTLDHVAVERDWGLELATHDGDRLGFVVTSGVQNVEWSADGQLVVVSTERETIVSAVRGVTTLTSPRLD